ncbi:hypothetical protein ACVXG9_08965 [Escherichia coli]
MDHTRVAAFGFRFRR